MHRVGEYVGGGYWANRFSPPSCWSRPFRGRVLDPADYRVWANTVEFPVGLPDLGKVMSLVLRYHEEGKFKGKVPVEWDIEGFRVIKWELVSRLRSYADELLYWNALKALRQDEINHPRRRTKRKLIDFLPKDRLDLAA